MNESPPIVDVGHLVAWCQSHSTLPVDEDEPYVFNFEHSQRGEEPFFRFVVSTQRLLRHCIGLHQINVDATYKVNWNGFPLMVIGTVDRNKKFHPLVYACCSSETTADFEFIFRSMRETINTLFDHDFAPEVLIADGANSIRNAFTNVFESAHTLIMC